MTEDNNAPTTELPEWLDPLVTPPLLELSPPGHVAFEHIIGALRTVHDPEIPVNIYELGLIYSLEITETNELFVKMTLTSPGCPVAGEMPMMVQAAIFNHVPEIKDCDVELVWDPPWRPEAMAETARLELGMF